MCDNKKKKKRWPATKTLFGDQRIKNNAKIEIYLLEKELTSLKKKKKKFSFKYLHTFSTGDISVWKNSC